MTAIELSAAFALLASYAVLMCGMFVAAAVRGVLLHARSSRSAAVLPRIRESLIDHLSGSNDLSRLREFAKRRPAEFGQALAELQGALSGSALDRLCAIALEFSLLTQWMRDARSRDPRRRRSGYTRLAFVSIYEPCRREMGTLLLKGVDHDDPDVRVAASRAVLHSGSAADTEVVFRMAISQTPLVRALLAEELRRHAVLLCERAVPEALRSPDPRRVAATLEMLVAWERAIPLANLDDLLGHPDRRVRTNALRLAPLVSRSDATDRGVLAGLQDPDPEINRVAAAAAGRMRLAEAVPVLARLMRVGPGRTARAAAAALVSIPPRGWLTLQELGASPNRSTAAAAAEALAGLKGKAKA